MNYELNIFYLKGMLIKHHFYSQYENKTGTKNDSCCYERIQYK